MSFPVFVYYCAIVGAYAALIACFLGRLISPSSLEPSFGEKLFQTLLDGSLVGFLVSFGVGSLDTAWNSSMIQFGKILVRGGGAGLLGLIGGVFGAGLGFLLVYFTAVQMLAVLGWGITGAAIGLSLGLFDWLAAKGQKKDMGQDGKIKNGLLGGGAGGFIGGILYFVIKWALVLVLGKENPVSAGAWGFVGLGLGIGFLIGLAQVVLREAWLRVEAGKKPGREVILGKPEILVGRSEMCDLGLFGDSSVDKTHAKFLTQNQKYLVVDAGSESGTFVNEKRIQGTVALKNGDGIRMGGYTLRFHEKKKQRK